MVSDVKSILRGDKERLQPEPPTEIEPGVLTPIARPSSSPRSPAARQAETKEKPQPTQVTGAPIDVGEKREPEREGEEDVQPERDVAGDIKNLLREHAEDPGVDLTQAEAAGKGFLGGFLRGGPVTTGAVAGGRIGSRASVLGPVAGAVGTISGIIIGAGAGLLAGGEAAEIAERSGLAVDPHDIPEEQRPAAYGGEALGAGLAGGGSTVLLAKTGARLPKSRVGNVLNRMLDFADKHPFRFFSFEGSASAAAGTGETVFESLRPGQPLERIGVGIVSGFLNPQRRLTSAAVSISTRIKRSVLPSTSQATKNQASRELTKVVDTLEDSPRALIRELQDAEALARRIPGFEPTAAQATGSRTLSQIESKLKFEQRFQGKAAAQLERSRTALNNAAEALRTMGSPRAFREAMELKRERYKITLDNVVARAQNLANRRAQEIAGRGAPTEEVAAGAQRAELSRRAFDIYDNALQRARQVERELYVEATQGLDREANPKRFLKLAERLRGDLPIGRELPDVIEEQVSRLSQASNILRRAARGQTLEDGSKITKKMLAQVRKTLSAKNLVNIRSELLTFARGSQRSTNEFAERAGRQASLAAEAVLDDIISVGLATKSGVRGARRGAGGKFARNTALDDARAYTRALNETFVRAFGGKVRQQGAFGYRTPPDVMLKQAFATGGEAADLASRELEEAIKFLPPSGRFSAELAEEVERDTAAYLDVQSRFLRLMADQTRAPDGSVKIGRLQEFIRKNDAILDRLPAVKQTLRKAVDSQERFEAFSKRVQRLERDLDRPGTSVIAKVLNVNSPAEALGGMSRSANPVRQLDTALNLARSAAQPEAVSGYRRAFWDMILSRASSSDGGIDVGRLRRTILEPLEPGGPSLRDYAVSRGLIPEDTMTFLDDLLAFDRNINTALTTQATGEAVAEGEANMLRNLFTRTAGAELGRRGLQFLQRFTGSEGRSLGPSLIVSQRGSQAAQEFVERIPERKVKTLILDAFSGEPLEPGGRDFSLLRELLEGAQTQAEAAKKVSRLHAYAFQAGILGAEDEIEQGFPTFSEGEDRPAGNAGDVRSILSGTGASPGSALGDDVGISTGPTSVPSRNIPLDPREDPEDGEGVAGISADNLRIIAADLRRHEGFSETPYRDTEGNLTIGFGHNLDVRGGQTGEASRSELNIEEANALLVDDIAETAHQLDKRLPLWRDLSKNRRRAILNMAFNLGVGGLLEFDKMIAAIRRNDFDKAAGEALNSRWAEQVGPRAEQVVNWLQNG